MSNVSSPPGRKAAHLFLLCHGVTQATRQAAFPLDESAEEKDLAAAAALAGCLPSVAQVFASPARCARQTTAALGLTAVEEHALRDCDWGRWRGRTLDAVVAAEPEAAATWLADPDSAPHGGESVAMLIRRVSCWMDARSLSGRVLAVTHPAVIRAAVVHAFGAPAPGFWRVDVPPLSLVELKRSAGRWSLRTSRLLRL
jgi:broad specificity phosphatase PhoE